MGGDERPVDLAVIGGGITGAAVARDASLRGLSVVLFEKGDFSSGTTSKSSRLIHGGLRYLEGFHFRLVYESLRERDWLSSRLPHLIRPVPILIPVYRGDRRGMGKVWIGMRLYDFLARGKETPRYGTLPAGEVARRVPGIRREGLSGGALFYDYQLPVPERLVMENLLSASGAGARVQNRAQVEEIGFEAGAFRLRVRDVLTGAREEAAAAAVINATGPWADRTRRLFGLHDEILHPTKGAHLVFPGISPHALFAASPKDDRMFYILPLAGSILVGTTDTAYPGDPDAAGATDE
ncbi:MAG: FAD-dependent oxidoreductase, partial [Deltaproteobacteria bacterium]|nr:FAD-dependent oxidoreductase [Deltaproteobacteria bacterium]